MRERSTYVYTSRQSWKEQGLRAFSGHMRRTWNVDEEHGKVVKTKAQLGRYNVIGSDDGDKVWEDRDDPGQFPRAFAAPPQAHGNDKEEAEPITVVSFEDKSKDETLTWFTGMAPMSNFTDSSDISSNSNTNNRHDDNHNHNISSSRS